MVNFQLHKGLYKVFPELKEDVLGHVVGVEEVSIAGRNKVIEENELIAFVKKSVGYSDIQVLDALKNSADKVLELWEKPIEYRFVESMPRTTIGKVDYRQLEQMAKM